MRRLVLLVLLSGCTAEDIDPMEEQPKLKPYSAEPFFADHRAMRTPPEGTVPRERQPVDPPKAITPELMQLGRDRFEAVCAACHGILGDGDSIVAGKMALRPPPSLITDKERKDSADELFRVITEGYGLMPRQGNFMTPRERWAVIAYLRALQLSQKVPLDELPADLRAKLQGERP